MFSITVRGSGQIGNALRRARRARGLTQSDVAAQAGVSQATVSSLETGSRDARLHTFVEVLAALGLEVVLQDRRQTTSADVAELF